MMEENDKIWELMALVLSNEASARQRSQLEQLLLAHPELEQQYQSLNKLWHADTSTSDQVTHNNPQLQRILQKGEQQRTQLTNAENVKQLPVKQGLQWFAYTKYAAAATLLLVGAWFIINKKAVVSGQAVTAQQVVTVKNGSTTKVVLADGTQVWLNAGSKLIYPASFTGSATRNVKLIGEGFFDVVKDKHHPFIVSTSTFSLKVLGTAFNVRAYQNDNTSEAALVRGKIEVSLINQPDKKIVLKPAEKLTIKNSYSQNGGVAQGSGAENTDLISLSTIHQDGNDALPAEASWIEHKLVFDEEPFESIARKIERRYNVKVVFKNNAFKHENFTGKFYNESVYKVLQSLQTIDSFHFNIKNDLVTIY